MVSNGHPIKIHTRRVGVVESIPHGLRPAALRCLCWCALLSMLMGCRAREAVTPSDVVMQLYTVRDALGLQSAPDDAQRRALAPFLADTLTRALTEADARRAVDAAGTPPGASAAYDGDLFSSLVEGPTSYRVMPFLDGATGALVPVEFVNDRERPARRWVDTVDVIREHDQWRVRDVRYGGTWDVARRGSLLRQLTGVR